MTENTAPTQTRASLITGAVTGEVVDLVGSTEGQQDRLMSLPCLDRKSPEPGTSS